MSPLKEGKHLIVNKYESDIVICAISSPSEPLVLVLSSCTSALVSGLDAATSWPDVGAGSVSGMWFKMGFS